MRNIFLCVKKKWFLCFVAVLLIVPLVVGLFSIKNTSSPKCEHTIVIDAGHGGRDGGAVGDQTTESYLNLQYSLALKSILEEFGYEVVLTRDNMSGLYSPLASNKKRSEMEKRIEIIEEANPDLVISVHMNSFSSSEARGAQVFYADGSVGGQSLAEEVQNSLHENIDYAKKTAKVGDYYVLNCCPCPSILVECGFLSNAEEEELLLKDDYMQKFCYQIVCGILSYFKM